MSYLYENTAKLYDADNRILITDDIAFYIERATKLGGKVLELACGTGRVTIPLAEQGLEVWGLDYSTHMIQLLEEKKSRLPVDVQQHIHPVHGDMTNFSLNERFKLIIIPFRSLQLLENDEQVLQCLTQSVQHLEEDGHFIVNVFDPFPSFDDSWISVSERLDFESELDSGERLTRHSLRKKYDTNKRQLDFEYIYRLYKNDGAVEAYHEPMRLRYYYEQDMKHLLTAAGFHINEQYGWYDGRAVGSGGELIFVCSKK